MLHWFKANTDCLEVRPMLRLLGPALLNTANDEVGTVETRQVRTVRNSITVQRLTHTSNDL